MSKVEEMARQVVGEWRDAEPENTEAFVGEAAADAVPVMTTALFQLVVEDNSLAFLDAPTEAGEPFRVLFSAIAAEVERLALELIEQEGGER